MGFDNVHPENKPKIRKLSKEAKRRLELGNKLIPLKHISAADKAEIFKIVTGKEYPAKRGRPSMVARNLSVTIDFLFLMGESDLNSKDSIMQHLVKEYELPCGDASSNRPGSAISDANFNKIVVQQLHKVESYLKQYVEAVDYGQINADENFNYCQICLQGLEKFLYGSDINLK